MCLFVKCIKANAGLFAISETESVNVHFDVPSLSPLLLAVKTFVPETFSLLLRDSLGPRAALCQRGIMSKRISQYRSELLRKQEKNILVPTVSPGSCFLVADTGVAAVTAEPNLPGLLSGTDLSFPVIRSNTRPLAFSRHVSPMYI